MLFGETQWCVGRNPLYLFDNYLKESTIIYEIYILLNKEKLIWKFYKYF